VPSVSAGGFLIKFYTMTKQVEIQNEINRLTAYIEQIKSSSYYTEEEKLGKIKDSEKRLEKQMLELAKLIDVKKGILTTKYN
jgi:hypothetical protein